MRHSHRLAAAALRLRPIGVVAAPVAGAVPGMAQAAAAPAAAASSPAANAPEVLITARRRSEQLQNVPATVTALRAKEMESKQVRRPDDLECEVPKVTIEQITGASAGARIFMRGVGADESLFTADPSVAIYIDDMSIARQTGALFDLQGVEVLRGPQGTLHGRNATGGAMRYGTQKPNGERRLEVEARAGSLGRLDLSLNGGGMIAEGLAGNFGLMRKSRDGYRHDITHGRDANNEKVMGGRVGCAFGLTADTSVRLGIDTLRQGSGPTWATGVLDPASALPTPT